MLNLLSFIGVFSLCAIAWIGSEARRQISWEVVAWGIGLQLLLGLVIFRVPITRELIVVLNDLLNGIIDASKAGGRFLFSPLLVPDPASTPGPVLAGRWISRAITSPYVPVPGDRLGPDNLNVGFIFAFQTLPQVVFFSALVSLLYALQLIQPLVRLFAKIFQHTMNLSGAEALGGAANIFVGIESALTIKPFLARMTRSELCTLLAACFGSIASTVLALYSSILRPVFPSITGHLVSASVLTIPACFVLAKILVPEQEIPATLGKLPDLEQDSETSNFMDSLISGALDGIKMAVGIAAVLIAVLGLVSLINLFFASLAALSSSSFPPLQWIGNIFQVLTVGNILGFCFVPLTFLTGVSINPQELWQVSILVGRRLVETEIPPYLTLASLGSQGLIQPRTLFITSYVLCGFAHLPSVGIFVGGLSSLVPSRRHDLGLICWKALWAAILATLMTGCIAGLFYYDGIPVLSQ